MDNTVQIDELDMEQIQDIPAPPPPANVPMRRRTLSNIVKCPVIYNTIHQKYMKSPKKTRN